MVLPCVEAESINHPGVEQFSVGDHCGR